MKAAALTLLEQAYRLDLDDGAWMQSLAEHAADLVPGAAGAMVYSFDATRPEAGVGIDLYGSSGVPADFAKATLELNRNSRPNEVKRFYHSGVLCDTVSAALRRAGNSIENNETYQHHVAREGYPDTFGLTASSPLHRGIAVNGPLPRPMTLNARIVYSWKQIGVHLQAAYRLRRSIRLHGGNPEAAVDPGRQAVEWNGRFPGEAPLESLRSAARAIDLARSRQGPAEAETALELWSGLVHGRWTLIESFEQDGRRLFLAYPNELGVPNVRGLSEREREVVGYVVQGDANKWIAYQLGLREATVARHLSRALQKLGMRHRNELIWFYHSLHQAGPGRPARSRKSE